MVVSPPRDSPLRGNLEQVARYRHFRNHGAERQWVFVTTTCLDFVHAFREPAIRDLMAASLIEDLKHYGSTLHAFVVMPHHVHFIAVVPEGKTIGWLMNRVKSNAARRHWLRRGFAKTAWV